MCRSHTIAFKLRASTPFPKVIVPPEGQVRTKVTPQREQDVWINAGQSVCDLEISECSI